MSFKSVTLHAVSLNTMACDVAHNVWLIEHYCKYLDSEHPHLVLFPELSISGYGCEDHFFSDAFIEQCKAPLFGRQRERIKLPSHVTACVGLPMRIDGQTYNVMAVIEGDETLGCVVKGIVPKQSLANGGLHYESRWFRQWPTGVSKSFIEHDHLPVGDLVFQSSDGVRFGFEICEDAWSADRPGQRLFERNVDVILNPSASHFETDKHPVRERFVRDGSRAFGCAYVYTNLIGCETGSVIYDGGSMIASNGEMARQAPRLTLGSIETIEHRLDLTSSRQGRNRCASPIPPGDELDTVLVSRLLVDEPPMKAQPQDPCGEVTETGLILSALSLGLYDWMRKTQTNGFVVSLSGGADSSLVAVLVEIMNQRMYPTASGIEPKAPLDLVSQSSAFSSADGRNRAQALANELEVPLLESRIESLVSQYQELGRGIGLNVAENTTPHENLQARTRSIVPWLIANEKNRLLLTTGNMSETAVGYMTMDGDTAGVLGPILGLTKTRVMALLKELSGPGVTMTDELHCQFDSLKAVVEAPPSAELKSADQNQSDADDLMPYEILDAIIHYRIEQGRDQKDTLALLTRSFKIEPEVLQSYVDRFDALFRRNQWKRHRSAPGFHIQSLSLDPRGFGRYPLLR